MWGSRSRRSPKPSQADAISSVLHPRASPFSTSNIAWAIALHLSNHLAPRFPLLIWPGQSLLPHLSKHAAPKTVRPWARQPWSKLPLCSCLSATPISDFKPSPEIATEGNEEFQALSFTLEAHPKSNTYPHCTEHASGQRATIDSITPTFF